ncbi:MAG: putative 2-aminoethylphosphonate ABC transporter substrate-binding protein, partial [Alphaproteobacteria bacterium]
MKSDILRHGWKGAAAALIGVALLSGQAIAQTELKVYTAIEADDLKRYAEEFNKQYPDIEIKWVRDSTGIVTAKLLAEKDNPQADIVWGLAATSLMLLKNEGMTQGYMPAGGDKLDPRFIDSDNPPHWTGMDAWVAAICINTIEAEKNNLPYPTSWQDLTKPVYKGHVVMPNPNSSGTGFLDVASWLQLFGEEGGWQFMDGLHQNIAWYTHSGSKPCRQAGSGETPLGVSFAYRGAKVKNKGAPIEIVIPSEGVGWEMEATAIMKGTDKLDAAKKLVDFSVSRKANVMYNSVYAVIAYPGIAESVENYPDNVDEAMIDNDFDWVASNRMRIL